MVTRVVVPLDGSALAAQALGPARVLAERTGASLLLLTTTCSLPCTPQPMNIVRRQRPRPRP